VKRKHENGVKFNRFGSVCILSPLNEGCAFTQRHSELVDKNRHIFGRIINGIKFCGTHGLIITGHLTVAKYSWAKCQNWKVSTTVFINSIAVLLCQKNTSKQK
jgi:hypothetical protein